MLTRSPRADAIQAQPWATKVEHLVNAVAAVAAYTLGTLAAWYETALLHGSPPPGAMLAGLLCGSVYLIFAVSVATAAASLARVLTAAAPAGAATAVRPMAKVPFPQDLVLSCSLRPPHLTGWVGG
jgi:ABC-2 type transport system permease protein